LEFLRRPVLGDFPELEAIDPVADLQNFPHLRLHDLHDDAVVAVELPDAPQRLGLSANPRQSPRIAMLSAPTVTNTIAGEQSAETADINIRNPTPFSGSSKHRHPSWTVTGWAAIGRRTQLWSPRPLSPAREAAFLGAL